MSGGIDEISYKLGEQGNAIKALKQTFDQHCEDDDRRHEENKAVLEGIRKEQQLTREQLQRMADASELQPLMGSKTRLAVMALVGTGFFVVLGWIAEALVKWALAHLLSMKFGG